MDVWWLRNSHCAHSTPTPTSTSTSTSTCARTYAVVRHECENFHNELECGRNRFNFDPI